MIFFYRDKFFSYIWVMEKQFGKLTRVRTVSLRKNPYFEDGRVFVGYFTESPQIGRGFTFWYEKLNSYAPIYTTEVVEIIDNFTFRTGNTIYRLITVEEERDLKIKNIFENE